MNDPSTAGRREEELARVARAHIDMVYAAALRRTRGDEAAAADVTQAVMLVLVQKGRAGKLPEERHMAGWLLKVTGYAVKQSIRSSARRSRRESGAARATAEPAERLQNEVRAALDESILTLGAVDREVVALRYLRGQSVADVARAMGMPENTAGRRIARALEKLRKKLLRRGITAPAAAVTAVLGIEAMVKAPAACAAAVTAGPVATELARGISWHITMLKAKAAVWAIAVAAGLALGTGGIVYAVHLFADFSDSPSIAVAAAPPLPASASPPAVNLPPATEPVLQSHTFNGRIVDSQGKPLAKASIWYVPPSNGDHPEPTVNGWASASDGTFAMTITRKWAPGPYPAWAQVIVHADGFAWGSGRLVGTHPLDVELPLPTDFRAIFLDPSGKPAVGLRVGVDRLVGGGLDALDGAINPRAELASVFDRTTDAAGAVEWSDLPREWSVDLRWDDPRFAQPWGGDGSTTLADDATSPDMTVHLRTGAQIQGQVINGLDRTPVPGVRIRTAGRVTIGTTIGFVNTVATADAQGRYALTQLLAGSYPIVLDTSPNDSLETQWAAPAIPAVTVKTGQTVSGCDLVLEKGAVIAGRVTDADTGAPLSTMIHIDGPEHPRNSAGSEDAQTDAHGRYMMRVPPGKQTITVYGVRGYMPVGADHQDVTVAEGQSVEIDFQARRAAMNVAGSRGKVVFDDGSAAPGARIIFYGPSGGTSYTEADVDGNFLFLPDGQTVYRASLGLLRSQPVTSNFGKDITLTLTSADVRQLLSGQVVDESGNGIEGAKIEAWTSLGFDYVGNRTTNAQGKFAFKKMEPDASYRMLISADGYGSIWRTVSPQDNAFAPVEWKLEKADGVITGHALGPDGKPMVGVEVSVQGHSTLYHTVITDATGAFVLNHIARNDRVHVQVKKDDNVIGQAEARGKADNLDIHCKPNEQ